MTNEEAIKKALDALDKLGVPYELFTHPAAATMEQCERVGQLAGAYHCKNLFLTNKRQTDFWLVLIGRNKRFRTCVISKLLGSPRLSFASDEKLFEKLGLREGSVSVLGLVNDEAGEVRTAIDGDILAEEYMLVHPNANTASLKVKTSDVLRFLRACGREPHIIKVDELMTDPPDAD